MNTKKRLFLLDGTALAYRSFFAFIRNPLINSKGVNTSGVFGFTHTLMMILRQERPDYMACVFDTSAPTFRHKLYTEYKATRERMPDELAEQLPMIREVVEAFRIPSIELEGFEADDVMGTLARQAESQGIETFLVTGDKDFMQLVSDRIKMYNLGRGSAGAEPEIIGPGEVEEKMGVPPDRIIDLLGLMGDSSDNVPGVPGVGPKTARILLDRFGTMEGLFEQIADVEKTHIREKLAVNQEKAFLSKRLVTIDTKVPVEVALSDMKVESIDRDRVIALFKTLEFNRFLQELGRLVQVEEKPQKRSYTLIRSTADFERFMNKLEAVPMFAIDLETTSLNPISADIVGFSFCWKPCEATYLPVRCPEEDRSGDWFDHEDQFRLASVLTRLKPLLEDPGIRKCGQNIKYDMLVLRRHGIDLSGVDFDSMVAAYLINPSARQFNIDALSLEYLNLRKIPTKDLIGTGQKQLTMAEVALEKVAEYACEDADAAYRLREVLEPPLKKSGMEDLFREVEMPLVRVLMEVEENGVALDIPLLDGMSSSMQKQLDGLKDEIYEIAGETFNINSTQQLGKILFEKLKVHELVGQKRPRRTKTGYATDVNVLQFLSVHPLPRKLLDYRQLMKLKSTYVDALPKMIDSNTGRVHASFNQTVAATGRLSTSDPNLQNIPVRTELGREIRKAFIPGEKGWVIVSADYSQIELRIMAHLSGDKTLIESFEKGEDVHRRTASEIFGIPQDAVTADHRRQAKTINFGIMYGMGAFGLASRLGIPREEAERFITAYFSRYPLVNAFIAQTIARAHENGFVTTLLNRRRYLPELNSDNRNIREFGERTAVNTPIQGTAADLIKVAMIRIAEKLRKASWKSMMILQIHDELLFEAPSDEVEALSDLVCKEMEGAINLAVPIKVDLGVGGNWYEAH